MNFKRFSLVSMFLTIFCLCLFPAVIHAEYDERIAVVYMATGHAPTEAVYFWEATFSAFAEEIDLLSVDDFDEDDLLNKDVLVFIGEVEGEIPESFLKAVAQYKGRIIAFGHNASQLSSFQNWHFIGEKKIRSLDRSPLNQVQTVIATKPPSDSQWHSTGKTFEEAIPYIVTSGKHSYIASTAIQEEMVLAVSKAIYDLLQVERPNQHLAHIQLGDITPITNAESLETAGKYLIDRSIPFTMSVSPAYRNEKDGKLVELKNNKKLLAVLKSLQEQGGKIVAHGYDQVYRPGAAEDAEFWDVLNDQKITAFNSEDAVSKIRPLDAYRSTVDFDEHQQRVNEIEGQYIENKLTLSVEALVQNGLYPIGFTPPKYAMSHYGYVTTSKYFTSLFGKIQLDDTNWRRVIAPLFITHPYLVNDMHVYPHTLGTPNFGAENPLEEMAREIEAITPVDGAVLSSVYPIYSDFDVQILKEMVHLIEQVGDVEWIDLGKTLQAVETEHVSLYQNRDGVIEVSSSLSRVKSFVKKLRTNPVEAVLWGVAVIVVIFLVLFFIYVSTLRVRLKKRLFEERDANG